MAAGALAAVVVAGESAPPVRREPFVLPHALAPVERIYLSAQTGWASELAALPGLGSKLVVVAADGVDAGSGDDARSPWTTDEWALGWQGDQRAVLHLPGERRLAAWGLRQFADVRAAGAYLDPFHVRPPPLHRFDMGGAVMASPPVPGFPQGRILVARDAQEPIKAFFRQQQKQVGAAGELIELDTAWLKIGHVDELVGFVPYGTGGCFRLIYPDPDMGLQLLRRAPPERALFWTAGAAEQAGAVRRAGNRWIETAGSPVRSNHWRFVRVWAGKGAGQVAHVAGVQSGRVIVDEVWNTAAGTAGLTNTWLAGDGLARAVEGRCESMPVWFEWPDETSRYLLVTGAQMWEDAGGEAFPAVVSAGELVADPHFVALNERAGARIRQSVANTLTALGLPAEYALPVPALFAACPAETPQAFAFAPSLVNLQVCNGAIILLRPFGPRLDAADDATDLFQSAAARTLGKNDAAQLHFLDGWNTLHRRNGGARCALNVWRSRAAPDPRSVAPKAGTESPQ